MTDARVPVMLSETDLASLLYAIDQTPAMERPSSNTIRKLRFALRQIDPERVSEGWVHLEGIKVDS